MFYETADMTDSQQSWTVYILRCADGTLYTGITRDLARRIQEHNQGRGAKYTRGRSPVELVFTTPCNSRSEALSREYAIKKLSLKQKINLIQSYPSESVC